MDLRIEQIFSEEMHGDTSFQEKETGLSRIFGKSYTQVDMRDTWNKGIKHGIEIGLHRAGLEGQKIELNSNIKNTRQKSFLDEFYKLAGKYNCAIQYHYIDGMCIIDLQTI